MTASYGREKMRQWANEVSAVIGVPQFYDTVNRDPDPADVAWWTLEFYAETFAGTFCHKDYIESGFIRLTVLSKPGIGDAEALSALETIVPAVMAKIDNTQRFTLTSYEPTQEDSQGSAAKHYRISVILNYTLTL